MRTLWIRWINPESKNYTDIIPCDLFKADVANEKAQHLIRRPNGTLYEVTCAVHAERNVAMLTYERDENAANKIWPGTTRIQFEDAKRKNALEITWKDKDAPTFVDLRPIVSLEDHSIAAQRYFAVKAEHILFTDEKLELSERPVLALMGQEIAPGDCVFVWDIKESGGLKWYGRVASLDDRNLASYKVRLRDLRKSRKQFGANEIDSFQSSSEPHRRGLYSKLKGYSHRGIRRLSSDEAGELLALFGIGATERSGENEIARLIRLGKIAARPNQSIFSSNLRRAYMNNCAITGCSVAEALEAAHIKVEKGIDDNDLSNGILLRADIHALFDAGLIALTLDGDRVDVSPQLKDPSYEFLRLAAVFQPEKGRPLAANIRHHRLRFGFSCLNRDQDSAQPG